MNDEGYPTISLKRAPDGYVTHDGRYKVVRDTFSDIGSSNRGCYKPCFHVYRVSEEGSNLTAVHRFCETLREARIEIVCDIEKEQPST